jgi:hypothetical protein
MVSVFAPPASDVERAATLDAVEDFLRGAVASLEPEPPPDRPPGRPRVLPALCLWAGLLVCVLRGFDSHLSLWRLLAGRGLWGFPPVAVSDQAVYHRLARDGTAPLERLFGHISALLAERLAAYADTGLAAFAAGVYALDETTLDRVARRLPALRGLPPGAPALLPGKLAGLLDLRRQQWARVEYLADAQQNERVAARDLVQALPPGSLVLADLGYFGFAWFDWLSAAGYWWVSRLRAGTSTTLLHAFYQRGDTLDALVWLGAHRADRAGRAVRLVRYAHRGAVRAYLTNVLDPGVLPLADVARLYARRWDIELAFDLAKSHLGLHLLWGSKPTVVLQQVWAVLTIAQVLQALRLEIAGRAGVDPFEVSLPLLVKYLPFFAARGADPVALFVEQGRQLRLIRPSSRTRIQVPAIPPEELLTPPPHLALVRRARHAGRKCGPRPAATT